LETGATKAFLFTIGFFSSFLTAVFFGSGFCVFGAGGLADLATIFLTSLTYFTSSFFATLAGVAFSAAASVLSA
jgi:hypothetical protein